MNALTDTPLKIRNETKNEYYASYESKLIVLPDAKTIIGVNSSYPNKLMMEDITKGNPTKIVKHSHEILTLLFDSMTETLLVGDTSGQVKQYKKRKKSNFCGLLEDSDSFKLLKDYGDVGVGWILSSAQVGPLAIFGGKQNSIVAINILEQRLCEGFIESPFRDTLSLQVCQGVDSNVYLSVGGEYPDYSLDVSDYLDVTRVYNLKKNQFNQFLGETDQALILLQERDKKINTLKLKIQKLEADLKKEKKQNQGKTNQKICKHQSSHFSRKAIHCN